MSEGYKFKIKSRDRLRFARFDEIEAAFRAKGKCFIAGVDEAGRGPLAGPVAAAACVLNEDLPIIGLNDSKCLSEPKREYLFHEIVQKAKAYAVVMVDVDGIDRWNILEATKRCMEEAVRLLGPEVDLVLTDAIEFDVDDVELISYIRGDGRINAIAAASILAKVSRDRYMKDLAKRFPSYGFDFNKGYGTPVHYEGIRSDGLSIHHRLGFVTREDLGWAHFYGRDKAKEAKFVDMGYRILAAPYEVFGLGLIDYVLEKDGSVVIVQVDGYTEAFFRMGHFAQLRLYPKAKRLLYCSVEEEAEAIQLRPIEPPVVSFLYEPFQRSVE